LENNKKRKRFFRNKKMNSKQEKESSIEFEKMNYAINLKKFPLKIKIKHCRICNIKFTKNKCNNCPFY